MGVQDAADVAVGHEARQCPGGGPGDLIAPFPQLGLDERQAERRIDVDSSAAATILSPLRSPAASST